MVPLRFSVTIARTPAEVFAVLSDPLQTPIWSRNAVEEAWITPGPVGVGSRRRAVGRVLGRRAENVAEVTAYDAPHAWTMRAVSGPSFEVTARFAPVDGGTRVEWAWSFELRGLQKLFRPLMGLAFGRSFARDLERLKAMMESGAL